MEVAEEMVATKDALTKILIIVDVAVICAAVEAIIIVAAVAAEVVLHHHTEVDTETIEVEVPPVRALTTTITHPDATRASELVEEQTQRMKTELPPAMEVQLMKHLGSNSLSRDASEMARAKVNVRRPSQSTLAICPSPSIEINFVAPSTSLVKCFTRL